MWVWTCDLYIPWTTSTLLISRNRHGSRNDNARYLTHPNDGTLHDAALIIVFDLMALHYAYGPNDIVLHSPGSGLHTFFRVQPSTR